MEDDLLPPPAAEDRPTKRTRRIQRDPDTESDSMDYLDQYLNESDLEDYQNWPMTDKTDESPTWQRHEVMSAESIEALDCQTLLWDQPDAEMYKDNCGCCNGLWKICRDPTCY